MLADIAEVPAERLTPVLLIKARPFELTCVLLIVKEIRWIFFSQESWAKK